MLPAEEQSHGRVKGSEYNFGRSRNKLFVFLLSACGERTGGSWADLEESPAVATALSIMGWHTVFMHRG